MHCRRDDAVLRKRAKHTFDLRAGQGEVAGRNRARGTHHLDVDGAAVASAGVTVMPPMATLPGTRMNETCATAPCALPERPSARKTAAESIVSGEGLAGATGRGVAVSAIT